MRYKTILTSLLVLSLTGCGTSTIVQRPGTVMVVTQPAKGIHVLAPDGNGKLVPQVVDLQSGDEVRTAIQK